MKILILIALLFICTSCLLTQNSFTLLIEAPDTASNVFSQDRFLLKILEPKPVGTTNEFHSTELIAVTDSFDITIRLPNTDWISILGKRRTKDSEADYYYNVRERDSEIYLNLLPVFEEHPNLFEMIKNGAAIQLRFQIYASINNAPFAYLYSNIEQIYLPPPNLDDKNGYAYLIKNIRKIDDFSTLTFRDHDWEWVRDQFPNSIISDLAAYIVIERNYLQKFDTEGNSPTLTQWLKVQWCTLLQTKSNMIRDRLKHNIDK